MTPQERHALLQETFQTFGPHYQADIRQALAQTGYQGGDWFLSFLAYGREPEPLTAEFFNSLFPYTNIENHRNGLAQTAEHGFLVDSGDGAYRLTRAGRDGMELFYKTATGAISRLTPLIEADIDRLAELLGRTINATVAAKEPTTKGQFLLSRSTDPGDDAPAIVRIDQYLTDLIRYREDAHLGAWQQYDVDGPTWETLTTVWREQAHTAAELAEQLTARGFDEATYAQALERLSELGWVTTDGDRFVVSEKGRQLREAAEARTDAYYLVGWSALNEAEQKELDELLNQLKENLEQQTRLKAWQLAGSIPAAWFPIFADKTGPMAAEQGLNKQGYFFILWAAHSFSPQPMSVANMSKRFPYYNAEVFEGWFANLVEDKFLAPDGDGDYYLTDAGRQAIFALDGLFAEELGKLEPLPAEQLDQIVALLGRVADASLAAEKPAEKWSTVTNRTTHRGDDIPILLKLDQYLDDLAAFRDDVHLAAFRGHEVDGYAWELLTFIWRDKLDTAAKLVERLSFRGYDEAATVEFLAGLVERGWLVEENGRYALTDTAITLRQEAEALTDTLFFAPWANLNGNELGQLTNGLERLRDSLKDLAADKAAADRADLYPLAGRVSRAIFQNMQEVVQSIPAETGLENMSQFFILFRALSFEPDPISPARLSRRAPYTNPQRFAQRLAEVAKAGHLVPGSNGESGAYRLTDNARKAVRRYLDRFRSGLGELDLLTGDELARLAELLGRIINAALQSPTPPGAFNLIDAHKALVVADDAPALAKIDQALDEFNAFRDDAHLAAFQPLGVSGQAWEAFSFVWNEEANTTADIAEKLAPRGYTVEDYAVALAGLVERGWLAEQDGAFELTDAGRDVREQAERLTNRYFYTPWTTLNADETGELRDLLTRLETALKAALPVAEAA